MLGIDMNIKLDVKRITSPIYFQHRNECVRCGAKGKLVFIDRFGRECTREVNALEHIKCTNCGKLYSILWEPKEGTDKLMPSPIDTSISVDFMNLVRFNKLKKDGENILC